MQSTTTQATRTVTAFASYEALCEACRGGYVPTLQAYGTDSHEEIRAKDVLCDSLRKDGFRVYSNGAILGPL